MSSAINATAASILGMLNRAPMSGWEVYAEFAATIGHFWSITRSQVYRELHTLASADLIELGETAARDRRICTITEAGREAFRSWIARRPGDENIRFPLLLTTFFGADVDPATLAATYAEHRSNHAIRLHAYESQARAAEMRDPFAEQTLRFGIAYERTILAWIDQLPWMDRSGD
jgi:DNA-binding PadR family transcriptional regulator